MTSDLTFVRSSRKTTPEAQGSIGCRHVVLCANLLSMMIAAIEFDGTIRLFWGIGNYNEKRIGLEDYGPLITVALQGCEGT